MCSMVTTSQPTQHALARNHASNQVKCALTRAFTIPRQTRETEPGAVITSLLASWARPKPQEGQPLSNVSFGVELGHPLV